MHAAVKCAQKSRGIPVAAAEKIRYTESKHPARRCPPHETVSAHGSPAAGAAARARLHRLRREAEPRDRDDLHVYGGETESPLNDLIDTFNETVGREQNIRVQVGSVTNTNTIHEAVLASAYGEPGATALPDMFVSYPKTVLALPDADILVDYRDYFSDAELDDFIPAFLAEGR